MEYLNYVVAGLVAIAGIITAITGLRKATEDSAAGASRRLIEIIDRLERQLATQGEEIKALQEARKADRKRIEELERKRYTDMLHTDRLEDLLTLAITFIDTLIDQLKVMEIEPPALPKDIQDYLKERNKKEK